MMDAAFDRAISQFETARQKLPAELFGVDVAAYRAALTFRKFTSSHWGGTITMRVENGSETNNSCSRYAAFVRLPPSEGEVSLVLCPQFSTDGADALRTLTILHELVHVVAGPNECRAMAFAAHVEQAATGRFTDGQLLARQWLRGVKLQPALAPAETRRHMGENARSHGHCSRHRAGSAR